MNTEITKTKSQQTAEDVAALLRARVPLIWIVTKEEARVEGYVFQAAKAAKYAPITWDCAGGARTEDGGDAQLGDLAGPDDVLGAILPDKAASAARRCWILRDLPPWLAGPAGMRTLRQLRNIVRTLPNIDPVEGQSVVVLSTGGDVPAELADHASVIEWPLPDRVEIGALLDDAVAAQEGRAVAPENGTREAAIDAAVGLSGEEALACYARSLVKLKKIDPATVAAEKKRVVARERVLEWFDPLPGGLDAVGGLENLKSWLQARKLAYSPAARAYGLPSPKGALLVGIPGTGKSLTAKAVATAWGVPLLRLDLGSLKSKFVGESEGNIRKAFKVIEALGRCVVWLDEIEKAVQGATSGSADGGTSTDQLGAILSWMQERSGEAFVFATANDISQLPPELVRKGRFDELFFTDLPTRTEREAILTVALRANGRSHDGKNLTEVINISEGWTGAEIAALVPEAMFTAFADGARDIKESDLLEAARNVVPLSKTAKEKIDGLRKWAQGKARPASLPEESKASARGRALDMVD